MQEYEVDGKEIFPCGEEDIQAELPEFKLAATAYKGYNKKQRES